MGCDSSTQRWFLDALGWGTGIAPSSDCSVKVVKMILHGSRKLFLVFVTWGKLVGTPDYSSYLFIFGRAGSLLLPRLSSGAVSRGSSLVARRCLFTEVISLVLEHGL